MVVSRKLFHLFKSLFNVSHKIKKKIDLEKERGPRPKRRKDKMNEVKEEKIHDEYAKYDSLVSSSLLLLDLGLLVDLESIPKNVCVRTGCVSGQFI